MLILALVLGAASGAATAAGDAAAGSTRLASLQIEIWPEFDRRAAALVILRGEIPPDVPLPATVRLRIAATSGGPSAVAYSAPGPESKLLNLKYDRSDAADFITLKFDAPERLFHVEFYDPLPATAASRSFTYVWTGDLAVDRLAVILQEPAGVSDLSVQPVLGATALGQDGLRYRSADLGPSQAGKPLEIKVAYTKTDARTSREILGASAPGATPVPVAGTGTTDIALWIAAAVLLLAGAGATTWWWLGRRRVPESGAGDAGFCRKCGAPISSSDRFCSKCGAPRAKSATK